MENSILPHSRSILRDPRSKFENTKRYRKFEKKKEFWEEKINRTKLSLKFPLTLADFEHSVKILAGNLP